MPNKLKIRALSLRFERSEIDVEARTVPMSVSSDTAEVLRYISGKGIGYEVLDHSSLSCIDLSRFQGENGGPLLFNHNRDQIIGRFTPTEVSGGKLRGIARFGRSGQANEAFQDVQDGILTDTSIYYDYDSEDVVVDQARAVKDDYPTYRVQRWSLTEASMVPVPADIRTGVGRNENPPPPKRQAACAAEGCTDESPCPDCQGGEDARAQAQRAANPQPPAAVAGTTRGESMTPEEIEAARLAALKTTTDSRSERVQTLQLRNLAEQFGKGKEANEILGSDKTLEEARALIMDLVANAPLPEPKSLREMGGSDKEVKAYSYARLLDAAVSQQEGRSVKCMELDIAQEIKRSMPNTYKGKGEFFAPFRLERAAMDSITATAGKELVFTQPGELIEILRNALIIRRLGARFLTGLRGPIGFSKQTGAAVAQWIAENGGVDATGSEAATGLVTLSPKTLIGTAAVSRQLLTLGTYDAELMVRQDLAYSHAAALDLAALHGTGGLQPTGIYNLAGVNTVAMGGNPTYAKLVDMIIECAADNAILGALGFATNPRVAGKLMQTLEFAAAGAKATWTGKIEDGVIAGYTAAASNLVKTNLGAGTNEHGLVSGCWDQMIVGQFGNGFEIITDPYALKKQGLIEVTTFEMADLIVRHAESFCKATGVTLS